MKSFKNPSTTSFLFTQHPDKRTEFTSLNLLLLAVAAGLMLAAAPAQAQNLLVNPGFETPPSGHATYGTTVATGWTYFSPPVPPGYFGDYWVQPGTAHGVAPHSGSCYWNEWGVLYNTAVSNVAGIYQTLSSAPGSIFQASGWMSSASLDGGGLGPDCVTWIQVEFLGASTNVLALYKSANFSASVGLDTWFPFSVTNACDLTQPVATGDPYFTTYAETGSVSQLVAPLGTTAVRFRYCYLQAGNEGGSANLDDTVLNQVSGPIPPVIANLFPQNMIFVNPSSNLSFNVSSPSGFTINSSGIHVTVNGTDVSGSLAISGSAASKNVVYSGLQSNLAYTVSISATDAFNLTVSANTYFETMWYGIQPVTYLWEAEDWDFNSGMYIDNPDLCNAPGDSTCYFGKVGVAGVDENNLSGHSGPYRSGDPMGQAAAGDYLRPALASAGRVDYCINPFIGNAAFSGAEWVNYTRDWPSSTNWIIARLATDIGLSGTLLLSQVTPTATNNLGTFTLNGGKGYTTFEYVYLKDTNGNNANIVLNGTETLRVTSGGNLLPNFFMLVAAQLDLPVLTGMYPTGTRPFEYTNALSFTVTTLGSTFPAGGIKVNLDGIDVSPNLVISGSPSTANVVYPGLALNAPHVAIITVTNALGHGFSVTNQFDTFTQNNFMFEAEDFNYGGGQFVGPADWFPNVYAGFDAVSNIDYVHTTEAGELFPYRNGIPQSLVQNYTVEARQEFVNAGAYDFQLDWFGIGDWADYTDVYPPGGCFVYVRTAGLNGIPFTMLLSQVVSGAGTTNQVLSQLGQLSSVGINQQTYAWVPLTDGGGVAPVVVKLGGTNTLQLTTTTGDCYPNYFMLVPASGISLSATRSGSNVGVSFPSETGATYRVFYRTNLTTGNWIYLTTALGNGAQKTVIDNPAAGSIRFYKVTSP
jgi:hypothetical protein